MLVKNFGFDIVRINSRDMLSTYNYGDGVLIKKSLNDYNTNDVVYFQHPVEDSALSKTFAVQRIFGLPGDSVQIINKEVFINGMKISDTASIKHNYYIKSIKKLDSTFKAGFGLTEGGEISDSFDYSYSLTGEQSQQLRSHPYIVSVDLKAEKPNTFDESCFPYSPTYAWNQDFYGPIYIPRIDDTLRIDTNNIKLYGQIIQDLEKNSLSVGHDTIYINGAPANRYVVKKNYYFVLGDNRGNSNDSRHWGYLPQNMISGKVTRTIRKVK